MDEEGLRHCWWVKRGAKGGGQQLFAPPHMRDHIGCAMLPAWLQAGKLTLVLILLSATLPEPLAGKDVGQTRSRDLASSRGKGETASLEFWAFGREES
eukprot:1150255-Pelagomonas_calceolata.AAC.7